MKGRLSPMTNSQSKTIAAWCVSRKSFENALPMRDTFDADEFGRSEKWAVVMIAEADADDLEASPQKDPIAIYWRGKKYIPSD